MPLSPDGYANSPPSPASSAQPSSTTGWPFFWRACLWSVATYAGSSVLCFFVGVVVGVTGLRVRLGAANEAALYAMFGAIGFSAILSWAVWRQGAIAGPGDIRVV